MRRRLSADLPADGDALIAHLMAGPTNAANDGREIRETISLNQYKRFFASLPKAIQDEVTARWGAPETDPDDTDFGTVGNAQANDPLFAMITFKASF